MRAYTLVLCLIGILMEGATLEPFDMVPGREPDIYKFTEDTAKKYIDTGSSFCLFAEPHDLSYAICDNSMFIVDPGRNVFIVMAVDVSGEPDTIIVYGKAGNGNAEFMNPIAVEVIPNTTGPTHEYDIFIADANNNRVVQLSYDYNQESIDWVGTWTGTWRLGFKPFNNPYDVACFWDPEYKSKGGSALYILDRGNKRIVKYDYYQPYNEYYSYYGDSIHGFDDPISICVHPNHLAMFSYDIYVADGHRIIFLRENSTFSPPEWVSEIEIPEARFSGVATDGRAVYAVDRENFRVVVLAPDLSRTYFVYGKESFGLDGFWFPKNISCDSVFGSYRIGIIENFTPWSGLKTYTPDLSNIPDDTPEIYYHHYDGANSITFRFYDRSSKEEHYEIWRKIDDGEWCRIKNVIAEQGHNFVECSDATLREGDIYCYKVRGAALDYRTAYSNSFSITTPRCFPPTITSLTFQDSVVVIEWNDNSRKNKDYYVGKKVSGRVAGTGHDTTFWYHMGHYLGDATSFIDTFPIEGENIYRVAAIDSTNHYWYSDYDTIDIPFYKADSFMALSLPDTSILFRWRDRTYLESGYSLRKDSLTGYMDSVPPDSCVFLYGDADLSMHRYYLVSWQKRDTFYFYWAVCDSLDYQWHVDNEPPVLSVYGGGRVIGEDSVRIEWDAEDNNGIKEIWVNDVRLPYNIREYTYMGDYAGWHSVYVKAKDFWGYEASSGVMAGIYYKDSVDISGFLVVQSAKEPWPGMYFMYGDIPETGDYKVYYRINSKRWCVVDRHLSEGSNGMIWLTRGYEGDTVYAFMCMEEGDRFRHYSDYKSKVWSTGGGGGGGCPYLYVWTGKDYEFDNSLLPESEHKVGVFKDHYILTKRPSGDGIRLKIKEWDDWTFIDRVRLFRVLHPESVGIGIYRDKLIGYVEVEEVKRAYDNLGFEWTDSVRTTGMGAYRGRKGKNGKLFTEFGIKGDYILADTKAEPPKITLASGGDTLYGRVLGSRYLTISGEFEVLDSVGVIDYVRSVRKVSSRYVKKTSLKPEEIPDEMRRKDGRYYIIEPGDSVIISFRKDNGNIPHGWVEDYMIEVIGFYTTPGKALGGVYGMIKEPSLLVNFGKELWFSAGGIKGGTVEVEVYDITGRQVKRMEAKAGSPGRITGLPSGVYFVHIGERIFKGVIVK